MNNSALLTLLLCVFCLLSILLGMLWLKSRRHLQASQDKVSRLRLNQQQLVQTNAHQQAFLDKLAHEYRTPLTIIQNACMILEEKLEGRFLEAYTSFDMIENAIQRLTRLVDSGARKKDTAEDEALP